MDSVSHRKIVGNLVVTKEGNLKERGNWAYVVTAPIKSNEGQDLLVYGKVKTEYFRGNYYLSNEGELFGRKHGLFTRISERDYENPKEALEVVRRVMLGKLIEAAKCKADKLGLDLENRTLSGGDSWITRPKKVRRKQLKTIFS